MLSESGLCNSHSSRLLTECLLGFRMVYSKLIMPWRSMSGSIYILRKEQSMDHVWVWTTEVTSKCYLQNNISCSGTLYVIQMLLQHPTVCWSTIVAFSQGALRLPKTETAPWTHHGCLEPATCGFDDAYPLEVAAFPSHHQIKATRKTPPEWRDGLRWCKSGTCPSSTHLSRGLLQQMTGVHPKRSVQTPTSHSTAVVPSLLGYIISANIPWSFLLNVEILIGPTSNLKHDEDGSFIGEVLTLLWRFSGSKWDTRQPAQKWSNYMYGYININHLQVFQNTMHLLLLSSK